MDMCLCTSIESCFFSHLTRNEAVLHVSLEGRLKWLPIIMIEVIDIYNISTGFVIDEKFNVTLYVIISFSFLLVL